MPSASSRWPSGWMPGTAPVASPSCSVRLPLVWGRSRSGDAAARRESAELRPCPPGHQQSRHEVTDGRAGVGLLWGFPLGREQRGDALIPPSPVSVSAGGVGPVPCPPLGRRQAGRVDPGGRRDSGPRVSSVVLRRDPVQFDRRGGEPAAVVAQQGRRTDSGGDGGSLASEFPHYIPVPGTGGGVGSRLDQQATLSSQPGSISGKKRGGGRQRDRSRPVVPACLRELDLHLVLDSQLRHPQDPGN